MSTSSPLTRTVPFMNCRNPRIPATAKFATRGEKVVAFHIKMPLFYTVFWYFSVPLSDLESPHKSPKVIRFKTSSSSQIASFPLNLSLFQSSHSSVSSLYFLSIEGLFYLPKFEWMSRNLGFWRFTVSDLNHLRFLMNFHSFIDGDFGFWCDCKW